MPDFGATATDESVQARALRALLARVAKALNKCESFVDVDSPVHAMGLDSLAAADLALNAGSDFGVSLKLSTFLGDLTLRGIACDIAAQAAKTTKTKSANPAPVTSELSHGQAALWSIHQQAKESAAYNLAYALRTSRAIETNSMRQAFRQVMDRHPALRTTFPTVQGKPATLIHNSADVDFEEVRVRDYNELEHILERESAAPFSLETGPLIRLRIYLGGYSSVLLIVVHHIISDFWSITVLLRDLLELYNAQRIASPSSLPDLAATYADFVAQRSEHVSSPAGDTDRLYWQSALMGSLQSLNLMTDRPRPARQTHRGAVHTAAIDSHTTLALRNLARETGSTLFVAALSAYFALLHRYTGQDDIIVGVPTSGRDKKEWLDLVGYFVNPVALRTRFEDEPSALTLIARTRKVVLLAMNHQNLPFPVVVDTLNPHRDPARSPIFQTMFVWQTQASGVPSVPAALALGTGGVRFTLNDQEFETVQLATTSAQCDITFTLAEHAGEVQIVIKYNTDLFDELTAAAMATHYNSLLAAMCNSPATPISSLSLE